MASNKKRLTPKQEKFIQEMLIPGISQREAYKRAYNCENMKDRVIDVKACNLLKKDNVRVRYEEMRQKLVQKAEEEGLLSATEVLKGIADIYYRNVGEDDKTALDALKTYGKHHKLFTDKVESVNVNLNKDMEEEDADEILRKAGLDPDKV